MPPSQSTRLPAASDFPFLWQRLEVCPVYGALIVEWGGYGVYRNADACEDDRGGHTAYEVWHWPSNTVESDWFTYGDAVKAARQLYAAARWPNA